jgi:hypothetical protein
MSKKDMWQNLVAVYSAQGQLRAAVIRSALESAGIPVMLRYESIGSTLGLTVDGIGRVDVLVPIEWADEARDLLNTENIDAEDAHQSEI